MPICSCLFVQIQLISVLCNSKTTESVVWVTGAALLVPDKRYRPLCSRGCSLEGGMSHVGPIPVLARGPLNPLRRGVSRRHRPPYSSTRLQFPSQPCAGGGWHSPLAPFMPPACLLTTCHFVQDVTVSSVPGCPSLLRGRLGGVSIEHSTVPRIHPTSPKHVSVREET